MVSRNNLFTLGLVAVGAFLVSRVLGGGLPQASAQQTTPNFDFSVPLSIIKQQTDPIFAEIEAQRAIQIQRSALESQIRTLRAEAASIFPFCPESDEFGCHLGVSRSVSKFLDTGTLEGALASGRFPLENTLISGFIQGKQISTQISILESQIEGL